MIYTITISYQTVEVEITIKDALTESRDWWKPVEMQFIKWTTEGMVKGRFA